MLDPLVRLVKLLGEPAMVPRLAPLIRQDIWAAIRRLKASGQSILVVDKALAELLSISDRAFVLEKGMTVWRGRPHDLTAQLQDRYLGV